MPQGVMWLCAIACLAALASARTTGTTVGNSQSRKFFCTPVVNTDPFCSDLAPARVCTANGVAVDASTRTAAAFANAKNESCPKDITLFTKEVFCKGGLRPHLPCLRDSDCDIPSGLKQCYGLCLSGGTACGTTTVPGADQCELGSPQAKCNKGVADGEVAPPGDADCLGLSDFQEQCARDKYGAEVFQPKECRGTFPVGNHEFRDLDLEGRKQFALELTMKINKILGYCKLAPNQTVWVNKRGDKACLEDEFVYKRPRDIRAIRVQMLNEYPTVFISIKQFCTIPLRKGPGVYLNGNPVNEYCDAPSKDPDWIFKNLTAELRDNMGPDQSTPLTIGPYPRLQWDKKFEIPFAGKPQLPERCFTVSEKTKTNPPQWVWAIVVVSSMILLLSLLILQHRFRNRVSYARSKRNM